MGYSIRECQNSDTTDPKASFAKCLFLSFFFFTFVLVKFWGETSLRLLVNMASLVFSIPAKIFISLCNIFKFTVD